MGRFQIPHGPSHFPQTGAGGSPLGLTAVVHVRAWGCRVSRKVVVDNDHDLWAVSAVCPHWSSSRGSTLRCGSLANSRAETSAYSSASAANARLTSSSSIPGRAAFTVLSITWFSARGALRSDGALGIRPLGTRHHGRLGIARAADRPRRGWCRRQPSFRCRRRWRRTRRGDPPRSAAGCRARRSRHRGVRFPWRGVGWVSPRSSRMRLGPIGQHYELHGPNLRGQPPRYNARKHETHFDELRTQTGVRSSSAARYRSIRRLWRLRRLRLGGAGGLSSQPVPL